MIIGFVGLGLMGRPMAGHLLKAGHQLFVNDLFLIQNNKPLPEELAAAGAIEIKSLKELASKSDVIITMVPDTPDVETVLFGQDGVADGLVAGQDRDRHELDLADRDQGFRRRRSTRWAATTSTRRSRAAKSAPRPPALTIMVGGSEAAFDRVKPLFELMGKNITLVGGNGAGQTTKVANQIIVALNIEAVGEALLFAAKAGADPAKVRQALMGGFASSASSKCTASA